MGRLFWKLFIAFLAALTVSGLLVAFVLSLLYPRDRAPFAGSQPPQMFMVDTLVSVMQSSGVAAVRPVLEAWRMKRAPAPLVVGPDGQELLGRAVLPVQLEGARVVLIDGADWRVIEPERGALRPPPPAGSRGAGMRLPPPPLLEVVTALLGALAFSAVLAWYLSRPVRHLHRAFEALAQGNLDARVGPLIGTRRDEIADLGCGFDRMAARIQRLLDAQRRLLHDVSHELRSPLARMSAAIGLARQDPTRGDAMFDRVELEAARLDVMVSELLDLSRLEHDAGHAPAQMLALDALLRDIVDDARFEAAARGVQVDLAAEPLSLAVHPVLLRRALDNVLRNAVKYSPDGSRVQVGLHSDGACVRMVIRDRGCGVADDELGRIFEPFFRGARSGGDAGHGTGLGLSIARRAIEVHGGDIRASTPPEGGLQIDIRLPRS
ncbi:MAG: ATP-binding protein [Methyloversatilis sp.]|uniref:sensor histidine kinase n=1 Tax=Methyloversatilis sp. TaxID=2569862 RepID=UPI002734C9A8|nr:ATP-binding protein [Methyloversatilis sp.]MDP2869264.1 ATP-binding protein [Methyloversatilis sp.]MDP3287171.1 ATP-binding protein [Methyloversatilis sp.]